MNKIRQYFSTLEITRGFFIALLSSTFIYLAHWGFSYPLINTTLALSSLFLLLQSNSKTWFWYGTFIGLFWFWWIALSLQHYGYAWGLPIGILLISFIQGIILGFIAWGGEKVSSICMKKWNLNPTVFIFAILVFSLSYIHPFGFDWFKPELMFIESYLGIKKWQFMLILLSISFSIYKKQLAYLGFIVLAYSPTHTIQTVNSNDIQLITTHTTVQDKWNEHKHIIQFENIFKSIDKAIETKKKLIILPESVFPIFLNRNHLLVELLEERAKYISIVVGGLYWDGNTPRNSTYIFTKNTLTIANKVLLVPFGESNPLPSFMSNWVNDIFYDGAIDYVASADITDYTIDDTAYRNAICFEATSEKLYVKDKNGNRPKNMIVLSNNGWFTPSSEPALQKLLLQYYSKKYKTTIYHSINMSESYIIQNGSILKEYK